jgi:hypothetical protein
VTRAQGTRYQWVDRDSKPKLRQGLPRAQSAFVFQAASSAIEQTPVRVRLFMYGEQRQVIEVSDRISQADLRKCASHEFAGRALTIPEVFPVNDGTEITCIPSFIPESSSSKTVVQCLEHSNTLYPVEVPADITLEGMVEVTSRGMGCPCLLRLDTRFPIRTDDRVQFASEQEMHLEQRNWPNSTRKTRSERNRLQWRKHGLWPRPRPKQSHEMPFHRHGTLLLPLPNRFRPAVHMSKLHSRISAESKDMNPKVGHDRFVMVPIGIRQLRRRLEFLCV